MTAIYKYKKAMRWFTRPKVDPSVKQLASSNPLNIPAHMQHQLDEGQLTPEEFYQRQSIPQSERPLTGAEGGRVYDTRKYFSRGQLVQPGPGRPGFKGEGSGSGQEGKIRVPLNDEEIKIMQKVYGVETEAAAKKKFGEKWKQLKSNIRRGTVTMDTKSASLSGFGPGTGQSALDNPKYYDIVTAELNKIKKQRNKVEFFDWKEGDDWYKALKKRLGGMNREHMNKLLNKVVAEEFPLAYAGKAGREAYKNDTVVRAFLGHLETVGEFDGNEKMAKILQQFQSAHPDHKFETINKTFRKWANGDFEVRGVDRSKLTKADLDAIKNWKPQRTGNRTLMRENQLKYLHTLNDTLGDRNLKTIKSMFKKKFPNAPENAFWHRVDQLNQLKRTGKVISGLNTTKSYKWNEVGERSNWLKEGFGAQFQGNYNKLINKADKLAAQGNRQGANRLYAAADKFFGPDGIFTKAGGQGEHPLSRLMGGVDQELKINSLVRGDLNQWKRLNFDEPIMKLMNEYQKTKPGSPERTKIIQEIEGRKKLMNILTEGPNEPGIVDSVKFNYGAKGISPSSSVVPIDKVKNFNVEDYVVRGNEYLKQFTKKGGTLLDEAGTIGAKALDFKEVRKFITENLDEFCTQKVASGGRIGFAGCTAEQILENMKKDQQKLLTYQKTGTNAAEAAKIAQKFTNASGKVMKLGSRGLRFMFGPAMLWGEPLFEGAFVAHDMIGNKTPFVEAVSKTYFSKPLRAIGLMKEPEEYEAESLYLKRDGTGVIPGVKAYTDARNKLIRINDLRNQIGVMEDEVESGVTLGAADALESLRKQLSKEMSDIRYDEKSLHNIMKKNEQQYNIAVERQRAERFEGVDPYEAQEFDPTLIGTGRDKRAEEMAKVNIGRDQDIYGQSPMNRETYNLWSGLANTPGEYQAMAKKMVGWVDQMGGPDLGPYKKMLAQGVTGPANKYTLGQVTTPADRYHWDKIGKLAKLGGFSYEKAFGGRVPFKTGGMSRRRFLEVIGALAGGAAAFKTGLLKIIKGSTGKTAIKAGDHILQSTPGMPEWYVPLINRIVNEGTEVTKKLATVEREIVHTKKIASGEEVPVYQNLDTGNVRVEYGPPLLDEQGNVIRASNDMNTVHLEYKAPEVIESGKYKGNKTKSEFSAAESEPEVVNWDGDIEFTGINEVNKVDELVTDTNPLKQFAKNKKPTMKEIVESSKKNKYKSKLESDTMEQLDYIEKKRGPFQDPDPADDMFDEFGNYIGD